MCDCYKLNQSQAQSCVISYKLNQSQAQSCVIGYNAQSCINMAVFGSANTDMNLAADDACWLYQI